MVMIISGTRKVVDQFWSFWKAVGYHLVGLLTITEGHILLHTSTKDPDLDLNSEQNLINSKYNTSSLAFSDQGYGMEVPPCVRNAN